MRRPGRAGAFVPVTLSLHVAGNASLTPAGGFMDLVYTGMTRSASSVRRP